jgi:hypothetical protein
MLTRFVQNYKTRVRKTKMKRYLTIALISALTSVFAPPAHAAGGNDPDPAPSVVVPVIVPKLASGSVVVTPVIVPKVVPIPVAPAPQPAPKPQPTPMPAPQPAPAPAPKPVSAPAHPAPSFGALGAPSQPAGALDAYANQQLFAQYCIGQADSADVPGVNYANPDVQKAARTLSKVSEYSYYFYSGPVKAYGLKSGNGFVAPPASAPAGTTPRANAFLVLLCGEFRDRAPMIQGKIRWINKLYKLPTTAQPPIDYSKDVWSQVSAQSYSAYLNYSNRLWQAKRAANHPSAVQAGPYLIDAPVDGSTVCETKYILGERIARGQGFAGLDAHRAGLAQFAPGHCSTADRDDYYDFRGDSNFKPNSPESNGMIWYSSTVTNQCASTTRAKPGAKITDEDCASYFRRPFQSRWHAARAGLAAWVLRDRKYDGTFADTHAPVTIIPNQSPMSGPFSFSVGSQPLRDYLPEFDGHAWGSPDLGLNAIARLGTGFGADAGFAYERLRDAVNRHTDWYASAYRDGVSEPKGQAYSPFVASSYEMSASNQFTAPGVTVGSPSDGRKHWMFVFRIHRDHWYNSAKLAAGQPIDFDTMWFDETSIGTVGLAKSEHAWDRLGTALEDELDSIIYLHNVTTNGSVQSDNM